MTMTGDIRFQSREELIRRIEKMQEWEEMRLAQVKGLREALEQITEGDEHGSVWMQEIARAALENHE